MLSNVASLKRGYAIECSLLSGSFSTFDDKIAWYENTDGLGAFGPRQVITTAAAGSRSESVFAADLDGDGDIDVLSASCGSIGNDQIAWYENTDGLGAFGPQQVITTGAIGAVSVFAADLDGDGDPDVLSASLFDNKIAWYENLSPVTAVHGSAAEIFEFALHPNYPNPFNPETIIRYGPR